MSKKIYILLTVLLFSTFVIAQENEQQSILDKLVWNEKMLNIMLDTRVDFQTTFDDGKQEDMEFKGQTIKVWLAGEIIPGIRYRVRHRLNKPQAPLREGYSAATDQAWLAFDLKDKWTFTVGKQSVQFGTFEYDYNPADIYLGTMCFDDLDAYKTGINIAYKNSGQTLHLQIINSDAPQFADEEYKNRALAVNTLWEGDLLDGTLRTRWAYGAFQHTKRKFYHWLTLGTQLNTGKLTTELDYYLGKRDMDFGDVIGNEDLGTRNVEDQSLSLNFKLDLDKWQPFIKGTWNQRYDNDSDRKAYQTFGVQGVVELYPFTAEVMKNLRFHFAYGYTNTRFKGDFSDLSNRDMHTFIVGTRWLFKVK